MEVPGRPEHWYQPVAEFLGEAYLRNAFTKGTVREVDFLLPRLGGPGRILDAGCGPGRHSLELARRGCSVVGVDVSPCFVKIAGEAAAGEGLDVTVRLGDLRELDETEAYDAAVCLCQGGFGLVGADPSGDLEILTRLRGALRPGRMLALSAFSAYYAVSSLEEGEHRFDCDTGLFHETAELRNAAGEVCRTELATACYTPRELRLMAGICGLDVVAVYGVEPGRYAQREPAPDLAELLLLARRPARAAAGRADP